MKKERARHPKEQTGRNELIWRAIKKDEKNGEDVAKEFGLTKARVHQIAAAMAKRKAKEEAAAMPDAVLHAHHTAEADGHD